MKWCAVSTFNVSPAERMTVEAALKRYLTKVAPTKRASTQTGEHQKAQVLVRHLGKYSLAALNTDVVAQFRDARLAGDADKNGNLLPRSNNTVRLELALPSHLSPSPSKNGVLACHSIPSPISADPRQDLAEIDA